MNKTTQKYDRSKYTGIYASWYAMKQRCNNPNNKQYADYGGRGVTYPAKWASFSGFSEDMAATYKKGLTLDRVNNNSVYSKDNCRWATRKEQNNNKRSNIVITFDGKTMPLALWVQELGVSFDRLRSRWYHGWSTEKILSTTKFHRFGTQK